MEIITLCLLNLDIHTDDERIPKQNNQVPTSGKERERKRKRID